MYLYRYMDYGDEHEQFVRLAVYRVVRETPCTFLIEPVDIYENCNGTWPKRVNKIAPDQLGKRFAYQTIGQAWESWRYRKRRQLGHTRAAYERAKKINIWLSANPDHPAPVPLPRANGQDRWSVVDLRIGE